LKRSKWLLCVVGTILVLVIGGPYVYIHFVQSPAPKPLTLTVAGQSARSPSPVAASVATTADASKTPPTSNAASSAAPTTTAPSAIAGTWKPTGQSTVGYRVNEVLFGQHTTAVGRTSSVAGEVTAAGTRIETANLTVDMTTVKSDQDKRDKEFTGRVMDTATFPTATFTLTAPIDLGRVPGDKEPISVPATGNLTLRGSTKPVTIPLMAQRNGDQLEINGSLDIQFADWGIPNPSIGPISTEDHGVLELLIILARD
jgi:polyisoprenoid-binding protein YceI